MRQDRRCQLILMTCALFTAATGALAADLPAHRLVERVRVPANGRPVMTEQVLEKGVRYRLRVSGTVKVGGPGSGIADAEYGLAGPDDACLPPRAHIDLGLALDDATPQWSKTPAWGAFRDDHVYLTDHPGNGQRLTLNFHDCEYADNEGELTVEVFRPEPGQETCSVRIDGTTMTAGQNGQWRAVVSPQGFPAHGFAWTVSRGISVKPVDSDVLPVNAGEVDGPGAVTVRVLTKDGAVACEGSAAVRVEPTIPVTTPRLPDLSHAPGTGVVVTEGKGLITRP